MHGIYVDKIFINHGIESGINSYLRDKEGMQYERIYTFEMYIIKALTIIYGEKSILLPYKIDNENAFKCNLLMYGLKESEMNDFIKYMNEYYAFMNEYKSEKKATGLIDEIEKILLSMIQKRSKKHTFTQEELDAFDTIFNPLNGELKQLKSLIQTNRGLIVREWQNHKEELTGTQIRLKAINPNLLDPNIYYRYGFDIKTIAELSDKEIDEINAVILREENKEILKQNKIETKQKLAFSTGYVMLDILLVLSSLSTIAMMGIILYSVFRG